MTFNKLWHDAITFNAIMCKHASGIVNGVRMFRINSYRFAKTVLALRKLHHNEFLNMVTSSGMTIDQWMDDKFGPIEEMGGSRKDLLKSIEEGMSEKEYIAQGSFWLIRKRNIKVPVGKKASMENTPMPAPTLTVEEQRDEAFAIAEALRVELRESKARSRQLEQDLAKLMREHEQVLRRMERAEKMLSATVKKKAV